MNSRIFWEWIRRSVMKRVKTQKQEKTYEAWLARGYRHTPVVTFVIQSHNASVQVKYIVSKLRAYESSEIIVIDDGSEIKHTEALAEYLTRGNEFLLRANDLYEIVTYDKAIRLANGKYVVLMQDDDDFKDLAWVDKGVEYLVRYPDMAILGGRNGMCYLPVKDRQANEEKFRSKKLIEDDPGIDFKFVQHVNRAPMWVNRDLFLDKLKHIDFSFAPFQLDDSELCLRAWENGLKVGWYQAGFYSLSAGGMRIWNNALTTQQQNKNLRRVHELHESNFEQIAQRIKMANEEISNS